MMPRLPGSAIAILLSTALLSRPLPGQQATLEQQLARALATLDSTETERGTQLLHEFLVALPPDAPTVLRVRAHLHLAVASLSLGLRDSAITQFREMVRANPFATPDPSLFNPDVLAAYREARRTTRALALRVAQDTVLRPDVDLYLVALALGQPDEVSVRLVRMDSLGVAAVERRLRVDSTSSFTLPLRISDSIPLSPGRYRLTGSLASSSEDSASGTLDLSRQPVDTARHEPPVNPSLLRPEFRKGAPAAMSAVSGALLGLAAAAIPMTLANRDLRGGSSSATAIAVGAGISVAGIVGVFVGRPQVPIAENVQYNRALLTSWHERDRAVSAANDRARRWAPIRIRLVVTP